MGGKISQKGFFRLWLLVGALLFGGIGFGGYWFFLRPAAVINKKDPEWLKKYCFEELAKLPPAPFRYRSREKIKETLPDHYIRKRIPSHEKIGACILSYPFDREAAYASLGVKYMMDIQLVRQFEEKVEALITPQMAPGWQKISPIDSREGGRPAYSYGGFPLIFQRKNPKLGIMEFVDFSFGIPFYVKMTVATVSENPITQEQAIQQIRDLPEVKKYFLEVPHARVEIDHESPEEWAIHVYEIKEDHTATMGWFVINKKDGTIKKTL